MKTDIEEADMFGPVKQVMQICYKAHFSAGAIIQGKIERSYDSNYITTYNEKGAVTQEQKFGSWTNETIVYNDKRKRTERIQHKTDGSFYEKNTYKYNERGQQTEDIVTKADGSSYIMTDDKYDENGKLLEHNHYRENGKVFKKTIHTYDANGNELSQIEYNEDGSIEHQYLRKYNEQGKVIEYITQYTDKKSINFNSRTTHKYNEHGDTTETVYYDGYGKMKSCYKYSYKYNEKGQCIETTSHYSDGKTHIQTHEYDEQGNRIRPPYMRNPKPETEEFEYDKRGNWIKKTVTFNKIPVNIFIRQFSYYGEPETPPFVHPLTQVSKEEIQDTEEEELNEGEAKWLADKMETTLDKFPLFRYYALRFNQMPSVINYTAPNIEAPTLHSELIDNLDAREIYSYYIDWYGSKTMSRYILNFRYHWGYLIYVTEIESEEADDYEVPEHIESYETLYFSGNIYLLRPSDASGKRDEYFEDEIQRCIDKCTLRQKPEKPRINIIEVRGSSFAMVEHSVDDDFEIKDLNLNYGYGFEKFHTELMERFTTSTKGLVLFHGQPGTGKTYYIRHLLRKMVSVHKKTVIYMPPNMVDHLVEPSFMTFLADSIKHWAETGYFSVLLIEDAEPLLAKRQQGVRIQGVSNLLNMTDGLLNDMLNLQIICTFNVDLKKLDSALLRPGRLIARKEFKPLSELDANVLAQRLGIKHHFTGSATLGEIYAMLKDKNTLIHDVEPEKNASKPVDDL